MNYEEMSNFEINLAVCRALDLEIASEQYESYGDRGENVVLIVRGVGFDGRSYCNNPSDAWPIILSNKIDIQHRDGFNMPCARHCEHMAADKNPLRAAMIVFLMMKDAECQKS